MEVEVGINPKKLSSDFTCALAHMVPHKQQQKKIKPDMVSYAFNLLIPSEG